MIIMILKKYCLSILLILTIFTLCLINVESFPAPPVHNFDKLVHALLFFGLSGVLFFDSTGYLRYPISQTRIFFSSFFIPVVVGGLIEVMQEQFTSSRFGDWYDFFYDTVGAMLGTGVALLINHFFLNRKRLK
jgi:VanZ family protein